MQSDKIGSFTNLFKSELYGRTVSRCAPSSSSIHCSIRYESRSSSGKIYFFSLIQTNNLVSKMLQLQQNPQPIKKIEITNTAGVQLCDLSWNPSITNILTYCLTDGTFSLLEFANDFNFSAKRLNSSAKAQ